MRRGRPRQVKHDPRLLISTKVTRVGTAPVVEGRLHQCPRAGLGIRIHGFVPAVALQVVVVLPALAVLGAGAQGRGAHLFGGALEGNKETVQVHIPLGLVGVLVPGLLLGTGVGDNAGEFHESRVGAEQGF